MMPAETRVKIFPPSYAEMLRERAGQKFRPSNGVEGEIFQDFWCRQCSKDDGQELLCAILGDTYSFDVDDPGYPQEWQYGQDGQPLCTAFDPSIAAQGASHG